MVRFKFVDDSFMATSIGTIGLFLDIVGVIWLFFCTSTKRIEAEISYGLIREVTDEDAEWPERFSFEEHLSKLEVLRLAVERNRRNARCALGLVVFGFLLQLFGGWM